MRKPILILFLSALMQSSFAQRITHTFSDVSMSDALVWLQSQTERYDISFVYNELEDFRVSTEVKNQSVPDAIQQIIGFYPIRMTRNGERKLFVECTHKASRHVKGHLVDEQNLPVVYANIALLSPSDSTIGSAELKVLLGGVSNEDGFFIIPCEYRNVLARISYVGYKTLYLPCTPTDLGTIRMERDDVLLKNVTVKGDLPTYRLMKGGMMANVEGTLLAELGTVLDVLEQLPRLQVDDDKVRVAGKEGTPLIYINGRVMRNSEELRQLKSRDIKSIEVLTTPGPQYASHVSSVIRIKTRRQQGEGWSGSLSHYSRWSVKHTMFDYLSLNYRRDNLDIFAHLNYENYFWQVEDEATDIFISNLHHIEQQQMWKMQERLQDLDGNLGFNYQIADDHTVGVRYSNDCRFPEDYHASTNTLTYTTDGVPSGRIDCQETESYKAWPQPTLDAYYIGKVGKMDIDLNLTWLSRKNSTETQAVEQSESYGDQTVTTLHESRSRMWAGKLVLTYPLGKQVKLNFGSEYTNSHNTQTYQNPENILRPSDNDMHENMLAGFAEVEYSIEKWLFSMGARYEHNNVAYYDNNVRMPEQSRTENHWMPTFTVGWHRGKWQHTLGMSTLVYRPSYGNLSNDVVYMSHFRYRGGNPWLKTMYNYDFEYNLAWRWLNFTAEYGYMVNSHTNYTTAYDDTSDIMFSTFMNVPHRQLINFSLTVNPHFGVWYPTLKLECYRQFFNAKPYGVTENLERPMLEGAFNNLFRLRHDWMIRLNYSWNTSAFYQFVERKPQQELDLNVDKYFFHKSLLVRFRFSDIFKGGNYNINVYNGRYTRYLTEYQQSRYLQLGITYYFNTTRSKYRGTGAGNAEKSRL